MSGVTGATLVSAPGIDDDAEPDGWWTPPPATPAEAAPTVLERLRGLIGLSVVIFVTGTLTALAIGAACGAAAFVVTDAFR